MCYAIQLTAQTASFICLFQDQCENCFENIKTETCDCWRENAERNLNEIIKVEQRIYSCVTASSKPLSTYDALIIFAKWYHMCATFAWYWKWDMEKFHSQTIWDIYLNCILTQSKIMETTASWRIKMLWNWFCASIKQIFSYTFVSYVNGSNKIAIEIEIFSFWIELKAKIINIYFLCWLRVYGMSPPSLPFVPHLLCDFINGSVCVYLKHPQQLN